MTPRQPERRLERRFAAEGILARVRPGRRLRLVNVSPRGALLEGSTALRPGARVDVQLEMGGRMSMRAGQVTRCVVHAIDNEQGVTYRAGLSFEESCDWVREAATPPGYPLPDAATGISPGGLAHGDALLNHSGGRPE